MAKKTNKSFQEIKEELTNVFDKIGGSISESEDEKILDAIMKHDSSMEDKLKFLVMYARDLERNNHYLRR